MIDYSKVPGLKVARLESRRHRFLRLGYEVNRARYDEHNVTTTTTTLPRRRRSVRSQTSFERRPDHRLDLLFLGRRVLAGTRRSRGREGGDDGGLVVAVEPRRRNLGNAAQGRLTGGLTGGFDARRLLFDAGPRSRRARAAAPVPLQRHRDVLYEGAETK